MTLRMIDLFSGIGGFSLAARWTGGIQTVQFVEREPFCQKILRKHWPECCSLRQAMASQWGRSDLLPPVLQLGLPLP